MKYIITKSGNYGIITPRPIGGLDATLDKYLQYTRQNSQYYPHPEWAIVRFWKYGKFPFGLIHIVKKIMDKYCESTQNTYEVITPGVIIPVMNDMPTLRPYQKDAIYALIRNRGGQVVMPCGSGKTLTFIEYFKLMNMRSLVIVPTKDIYRQWKEYNLPNLTVSTFQNPKLKDIISSFQIILVDEHHRTAAKTIYNNIMRANTSTIICGTSATDHRDDGEDMRILAALGEKVYEISRKELISQGYLANAVVRYLKPRFQTNGKYMTYQKVYDTEIVHNIHRNNLAIETAIIAAQNHRKVLILVSQIVHGDILVQVLSMPHNLPRTNDLKIIFMNGQSKDRDQNMSQYDIIIATTIYDEGWNLETLDTLILCGSGKSSVKVTQRVGRVLRLKHDGRESIIYDFDDSAVKYLKSQYLKRRAILEQEFEIIESESQATLD